MSPGSLNSAVPRAFYIKLGRAGIWEADSIARSIMRIGWDDQRVEDINEGRWDEIARELQALDGRSAGAATTDLRRLQDFAGAKPDDLWITFHQGKLWWTHLEAGPVEADTTSKFRRTQPWRDCSASGKRLFAAELPGTLASLQAFRGTVCNVRYAEALESVITGRPTPLRARLLDARQATQDAVAEAIRGLHWKDFETLTDLVFRAAGWVRVGILGETVKSFDLELREPITGDRYAVQVKSQAGWAELEATLEGFSARDYKRLFFVVHTPQSSLAECKSLPHFVDLVLPSRMSELVLDAGLLRWLEDRLV